MPTFDHCALTLLTVNQQFNPCGITAHRLETQFLLGVIEVKDDTQQRIRRARHENGRFKEKVIRPAVLPGGQLNRLNGVIHLLPLARVCYQVSESDRLNQFDNKLIDPIVLK